MKKLTCFISDSKLLDRVSEFCEREKFTLELLTSVEDFEYDAGCIVYITDNLESVCSTKLKEIPVCYIGSDKTECYSYLLPPDFQYIHMRCLVDAIAHSGCFEVAAVSATPVVLSKEFRIKNDIFGIEKVVFTLTKDFVYFLDFSSLEKIRVGLSEMLTNAIEHGNLHITGDEKFEATDNGTYYDLVDERLKDPVYNSKLVTFSYKIDNEGISMEIEDEGEGFDVESLPDPTDPESLLKLHGRGILITRMYFDEVLYNDKGNKVKLTKRF